MKSLYAVSALIINVSLAVPMMGKYVNIFNIIPKYWIEFGDHFIKITQVCLPE